MDTLLKGRGGIRPGQIPTIVDYDVPSGKKKKKKAHHVQRRQWITPEQAIRTKADIDWEFIEKTGVRIPKPDEINPNVSSKIADEYFKMFYRNEEPNFEKRLHRHEGAGKLHNITKVHKGERTQRYHKNELVKFQNEYYGRYEEPSWLDQYNVREKTVPISIGEFKTQATQYSVSKGPVVLTWEKDGIPHVYSEKYLPMPTKFTGKRPNVDALNAIKGIFERELVKKAIGEIIKLEGFRENIIRKTDDLLNHSLEENNMVYHNFKSGEDEVNLAGINGNYSISVNQIPVDNTNDLRVAIAKYYSEISKIIDAQNEDKDVALELLGERLITMNREIRPAIEKLGNNDETTKWLKGMDFSELNFEIGNNGILKFLLLPSITTAEPWKGAEVQMVPLQEEMGVAADGTGAKPGKKELKREDYKRVPKDEIRQRPIEESNDMENKAGISPAIIAH